MAPAAPVLPPVLKPVASAALPVLTPVLKPAPESRVIVCPSCGVRHRIVGKVTEPQPGSAEEGLTMGLECRACQAVMSSSGHQARRPRVASRPIDLIAGLERLARLREQQLLSDDEFTAAKAKLLSGDDA